MREKYEHRNLGLFKPKESKKKYRNLNDAEAVEKLTAHFKSVIKDIQSGTWKHFPTFKPMKNPTTDVNQVHPDVKTDADPVNGGNEKDNEDDEDEEDEDQDVSVDEAADSLDELDEKDSDRKLDINSIEDDKVQGEVTEDKSKKKNRPLHGNIISLPVIPPPQTCALIHIHILSGMTILIYCEHWQNTSKNF